MDIYQTIMRPVITEKSTMQSDFHSDRRGGAYTFEVHPDANKVQIREAIEKIYRVKVLSLRTLNKSGKLRRFRQGYGKSKATKRAVAVLDPNSAIDLF